MREHFSRRSSTRRRSPTSPEWSSRLGYWRPGRRPHPVQQPTQRISHGSEASPYSLVWRRPEGASKGTGEVAGHDRHPRRAVGLASGWRSPHPRGRQLGLPKLERTHVERRRSCPAIAYDRSGDERWFPGYPAPVVRNAGVEHWR